MITLIEVIGIGSFVLFFVLWKMKLSSRIVVSALFFVLLSALVIAAVIMVGDKPLDESRPVSTEELK